MAKVVVGIRLDTALLDRLRNAVWHLGKGLTITSVLSAGIEKELGKLEGHNGGKPYPRRGRNAQALKQFLPRKRQNKRPPGPP